MHYYCNNLKSFSIAKQSVDIMLGFLFRKRKKLPELVDPKIEELYKLITAINIIFNESYTFGELIYLPGYIAKLLPNNLLDEFTDSFKITASSILFILAPGSNSRLKDIKTLALIELGTLLNY